MTIVIRGMYGMGDCIHQRAVIRTLMDTQREPVVLETFYWSMYDDLVRRGLRLRPIAGVKPRIRDEKQAALNRMRGPIERPKRFKLSYTREAIHTNGSILAAMYASVGLKMPERPDFGLSVPSGWRMAARSVLGDTHGRPVMVLRPSVLNNLWRSESRAPDHASFSELYQSVRERFFVVSVANLGDHGEAIDGPTLPADLRLEHGELGFEELAGLFAEARMVFTPAGFAPVLAQMAGTPVAIVYGGNENFSTTNTVGSHLAPTLAIEPINPCACHLKNHACDKTIDMLPALERLERFALQCAS